MSSRPSRSESPTASPSPPKSAVISLRAKNPAPSTRCSRTARTVPAIPPSSRTTRSSRPSSSTSATARSTRGIGEANKVDTPRSPSSWISTSTPASVPTATSSPRSPPRSATASRRVPLDPIGYAAGVACNEPSILRLNTWTRGSPCACAGTISSVRSSPITSAKVASIAPDALFGNIEGSPNPTGCTGSPALTALGTNTVTIRSASGAPDRLRTIGKGYRGSHAEKHRRKSESSCSRLTRRSKASTAGRGSVVRRTRGARG